MSTKTAVVLMNLGGPDSLEAVQPFLFNLFSDSAIIALPNPLRWAVAKLISTRRAPVAQEIYAHMGGRSPLVPQTELQAKALQDVLGPDFKVVIAMRYWKPFTDQAVAEVKAWGADRVVLLPLYPQFSTTTSRSSMRLWHVEAKKAGLNVPTEFIHCYASEPGFIKAEVDLLKPFIEEASKHGKPRILFSAHGLPKRTIEKQNDPYQRQVEQSVAAVVAGLNMPGLDVVTCYQSRVGPMEWIGPSTEDEIHRAVTDKVPLVVVPIAFVSEHSETLVELDIEYGDLAREGGIPYYGRVPTVTDNMDFIQGLAKLVLDQKYRHQQSCDNNLHKCPV